MARPPRDAVKLHEPTGPTRPERPLASRDETLPARAPEASASEQAAVESESHTSLEGTGASTIDPLPPDFPFAAGIGAEQPGRYEEIYVEGRGGQARVLNVFDKHLGRRVALKEMIHDPDTPQTQAEGRFFLEARVAARLEHPNIVPVHEAGRRTDGRLYYTMRLVHGETLSSKLSKCRDLKERLTLLGAFWDTCKAIAYAHSRGVIHRDLKPANVMLGQFGETVLLDWGLAKLKCAPDSTASNSAASLPTDPNLTGDGLALGTPSYMSPEQARGEEIDERTDVWGLGAVLYKLLTGEAPFSSGVKEARIARAMLGGVRDVRSLCPEAPVELAAIAHKALQRDKKDRYQTAKELADEIGAYMTGGRVRAYAYSPWELLRRFAAEHRGAVIASLVALLAVVGALVVVSVALGKQTQARQEEQRQRLEAELNLAGAYAERADRQLADYRFVSAYGFAAMSLRHNPAHPTSPGFQPGFEEDFPRGRHLRVRAASTALQARYHFNFEPARLLRVEDALGTLEFSPDGRALAAGAYDGAGRVWDAKTGQPLMRLEGDGLTTYGVIYSPDGKTLATSGKSGHILLWSAADGARIAELSGHEGLVRGLAFSPDGALLASAGADRTIRIWDLARREERALLIGHEAEVRAVVFSRDGSRLFSGGIDRSLRVWDPATRQSSTLARLPFSIRALALSPDGERIAIACDEPTVNVLDARTGEPDLMLGGNASFVRQVAWSPDGSMLASAGLDRTVRVWNSLSGEPIATLEEHQAIASGVAFSPDGSTLASAAFDGSLRTWRIRPSPLLGLAASGTPLHEVAFSPDGRRLATSSRDGTLRVWDLETKRELGAFRGELTMDVEVSFGPDGALLAGAGGVVEIWSVETGKLVRRLPLEMGSSARISPDGRIVATGEETGRVTLWELATGERLQVFEEHTATVFDLEFSPDGRTLASAGKDGHVRLWDLETGKSRGALQGRGWISSIDFTGDGRLASAGKEGQSIIWDVATGEKLLELEHGQWTSVRFVGDGRYLATACDDQYVRFWDSRSGELLLIVRAPRELVSMDVDPQGQRFAINQGHGFAVHPIDLTALEVDPARMLKVARSRGFVVPEEATTAAPTEAGLEPR
ncbi:MAG: protein kinase domain-containing protein [Myxococcales bacterium]